MVSDHVDPGATNRSAVRLSRLHASVNMGLAPTALATSMADWLSALRYAFRTLRRQPTFALIAVLTLTLGIGANTALFSIIRAVVLNPLPYEDPEKIVVLWEV